jgi:hypothetical protein
VINYTVGPINNDIAKRLIIENHYSHSWNACKYALGLYEGDMVIGVAVYRAPAGRLTVKSISPNLQFGDVLELTRLWLKDEAPKNSESFFIGKTFEWIRKNTKTKVLISYSDPMHNHLGVIYQATNWLYQGNNTMLAKSHLHRINGVLYHQRTVTKLFKTIKPDILKEIDPDYERVEMLKKHRYIYILHKKERKKILLELKHKVLPYPKNNLNCTWDIKKK